MADGKFDEELGSNYGLGVTDYSNKYLLYNQETDDFELVSYEEYMRICGADMCAHALPNDLDECKPLLKEPIGFESYNGHDEELIDGIDDVFKGLVYNNETGEFEPISHDENDTCNGGLVYD